MLVIKNLSKTVNGRQILKDISLQVDPGEIAVLLGASGVGKSTLLRILNNLDPFTSGTIELDGKPLDLSAVNRNHTIGMVFQQFNLFDHLTVKDNIIITLEKVMKKNKKEAEHIADQLLEHYGLEELAHRYPVQLSGGQKQRLAIARSVALKPRIICFDEPTSALDPFLTNMIATNIQELANEGYIVLVASHDVALLEKLNCTIHLMDKGTIIESAQSSDFWENPVRYPRIKAFIAGNKKHNG